MNEELFITTPLSNHPFTPGFQEMCEYFCFKNISQILNWPVSQLLNLNGFTYHHYQELWKYLDKNGLTRLIKF